MNSDLVVGIATVTRYDLLETTIAFLESGTCRPDRIILIDNGRRLKESLSSLTPIEVVRPPYNLGVAASWNEIHRRAGGDVVILNDDVFVGRHTIEFMLAAPGPFVSPIPDREFSCFLQRQELWESIGPYDEGFWPAYHEDQDYFRRMQLRGFRCETVPSDGLDHVVGATGHSFEPAKLFIPFVKRRYARKWGGAQDCEVFERAWNGRPESWDDLEENYRYLAEIQAGVEGKCSMKDLRELASDCAHMTDLGCGLGFSTTSLLATRPEKLVAVDCCQHPLLSNVFRLAKLYTKSEFVFREADTLEIDLEFTDLLLIDAAIDAIRFREQLEKYATVVRKRIVARNTFYDCGEGISPRGHALGTIKVFLANHQEWELHPDHNGDGDRTVLQRRQ